MAPASGATWLTTSGTPPWESFAVKGRAIDTNVAYTSNGQTRPGVAQAGDGINIYRIDTAVGPEVLTVGLSSTQPIGNCNL